MRHKRHTSPITTVDALSDGGLIITGGYDGQVILWTHGLVAQWNFRALDLINHVSFSPDGKLVAVASADAFVYVLEVADGTLRSRLGPFDDDVNAVAWHPNGATIACVMDASDRVVRLLEISSGDEVQRLEGHEHGVFAVAFDPSGRRIATAAEDGTARIWELEGGAQVQRLDHPGDPETISWSPMGNCIATGCDDGVLRVWNSDTGQMTAASRLATAAVRFVRYSDDGGLLLSGSYDGSLRVLESDSLKLKSELRAPFQWERSAAFLGSGVVVGSFGGEPIVHRRGRPPNLVSNTFGINCMTITPSQVVLVGRDDGAVVAVGTDGVLFRHDSIVNGVAISSDENCIASCDYLGTLTVFDRSERTIVAQRKLHSGPLNSVVWLPDGCLASAGYDGHIRIWSDRLDLKSELQAHEGPIKSICFSKPCGVLIAGSSDDTISGWRNGLRLFTVARDDLVLVNSVTSAAIAPLFASASRDGLVRLWSAETGDLIAELPRSHKKSVKAVSVTPDARHLVSGSYDGQAILWTRCSNGGYSARALTLHGKPGIPAVGFREHGVVTAGWNGSVGLWTLAGELEHEHRLEEEGQLR